MLDTVYCCAKSHKARVYNLPSKRGRWKRLYFLDECSCCGNTIAILRECTNEGAIKISARKTGQEAIRLRDKLAKFAYKDFIPKQGSYNNQLIFYNNRGIILNFNDYRVGKNEDFCTHELLEISG